ncbi:PEGA domain-containing protein [Winogradskyella poriferorum]|uniref:PEGA domain-containing protein n=1 Tax=Winogradskyella poriferorum TaxID=307627 RepID=UPI003D64A25B
MKQKLTAVFLSCVLLFTTSCASIVSKSNYPITINSSPSDAKITITDKNGKEVYKGNTPAELKLKAGSGFFSKASYQVKFEKMGYDTKLVPIEFKLDGWYFGNILIGGLIGLLIVDPATGAMYKLDKEYISETLSPSTASVEKEALKFYTIDTIPEAWRPHLVALSDE